MRYQNWDVLLFPQEGNDIKTPLQEFKTCCDVVQDPNADLFTNAPNPAYYSTVTRPLPTVSCYVPSLVCGHAFRVSLHCWSPPEATRAPISLESKDDLVVFEAKVLLDGVCVAGLVFRSDAHWPQIIDHKDGKLVPLRFPPFHHEMISQAWVFPAQSMGRIKIIIAEGISHGPPGTTPFERTRNLVAFSFQHTPLHILEDSGIAWPNPNMFYQALHQDLNPLSPRTEKNADPDSHAHSPRPRAPANMASAPGKLDSTVPLPSFTYGMMQSGMMQPPPPFKVPGHQVGDPFLPHFSHHDPFGGIGEHLYRRRFLQENPRQTSSTGDASMHDAPTKSRSTISDQPMPDYIRPLSPIRSYESYPMNDYSRPLSPESHRTLSLPAFRPQSPTDTRQVSAESLRGPRMQRLFSEAEAQSEGEALFPEHSQFVEMIDAMSPRKVPGSGYYPPANTRVSSATNTPPAAARSSAAEEARASSYGGKNRSVSNGTRDLPPPTHSRTASEIALNTRTKSRKTDCRQSEIFEEPTTNPPKVIKKTPSTNVKSRKENRAGESGHEDGAKSQCRISTGSTLVREKENVDTLQPSGGDSKRRRVSDHTTPGKVSVAQATIPVTPTKITSNIESQTNSPDKINEIDDLTPEGVVIRAPLGELGNMM